MMRKSQHIQSSVFPHNERKRNRLSGYDYSQDGFYFVTVCVRNSDEIFGEIKKNKVFLNEYGKVVEKCWLDLPKHYSNCLLDVFVIMPNHIHGIVLIENNDDVGKDGGNGLAPNVVVGNGLKPFPTGKRHGLSEFIRGFKTFSSRKINEMNQKNIFHWQKSFYDHVIRDEKSLNMIREYIMNNPLKWELDRNNTENLYM